MNHANKTKSKLIVSVGLLLCAPLILAQEQAGKPDERKASDAGQEVATIAPRPSGLRALKANPTAAIPVVSLRGVCEDGAKAERKSCNTVITRADVDVLISLIEPNASAAARRQFAINYSRLAAAAGEAQRRDLDKDAALAKQIETQQKLLRMQLLANALFRRMQSEAEAVATADIEKFYTEHQADFMQGKLRRIFIPKSMVAMGHAPLQLDLLQSKAESLRTRAVSGEDFEVLQSEVFKDLGAPALTPSAKPSLTIKTKLPVAERMVFDLEVGQVSPVIETASAFEILKLDSKTAIPVESARAEILPTLQRDRMREKIQEVTASGDAQFNLKFLELASAPEFLPPPQLSGLVAEEGTPYSLEQRMPLRRPAASRRRETTALPPRP
jgi:PPIC-type PPIASE domain